MPGCRGRSFAVTKSFVKYFVTVWPVFSAPDLAGLGRNGPGQSLIEQILVDSSKSSSMNGFRALACRKEGSSSTADRTPVPALGDLDRARARRNEAWASWAVASWLSEHTTTYLIGLGAREEHLGDQVDRIGSELGADAL